MIGKGMVLNNEPLKLEYLEVSKLEYEVDVYKGEVLVKKHIVKHDEFHKFEIEFRDFQIMFAVLNNYYKFKEDIQLTQKNNRYEEFKKVYGISLKDILLFGDTTKSIVKINRYIPHVLLPNVMAMSIKDSEKLPKRTSYPCYVNKDYNYKHPRNAVILHEDYSSCWKCLMDSLGNPTYGVIYKQYI